MGTYATKPETEKISVDGKIDGLSFGSSTMQGWRITQEDAHDICFNVCKDTHMFAVYDGHGGSEVAIYCKEQMPSIIRKNWSSNDIPGSLKRSFLDGDAILKLSAAEENMKNIRSTGGHEKTALLNALFREHWHRIAARQGKSAVEDVNDDEAEAAECSKLDDNIEVEVISEKNFADTIETKSCHPAESAQGESHDDEHSESDTKLGDFENSEVTKDEGATERTTTQDEVVKVSPQATVYELEKPCSGETIEKENGKNGHDITESSEEPSKDEEKCSEVPPVSTTSGIKDESNIQNSTKSIPEVITLDDDSDDSLSEEKGYSMMMRQANDGESSTQRWDMSHTFSKRFDESFSVHDGDLYYNGQRLEESTAKHMAQILAFVKCCNAGYLQEMIKHFPRRPGVDMNAFNPKASEQSEPESEVGDEFEDASDDEVIDVEDEAAVDSSVQILQKLNEKENIGHFSGSTAVIALLHCNVLFVGNVGDSRCVLCRSGKALDLTKDHKPEDESERKRISNAGGKVDSDGRVNGLNLSRALGDHLLKSNRLLSREDQLISCIPDITQIPINTETDEFMVLACDGIWNSFSSQEVVDFIRVRIENNMQLSMICEELFDVILAPDTRGDGTGCDNMTCVIVKFAHSGNKPSAKRISEDVVETPAKKKKVDKDEV